MSKKCKGKSSIKLFHHDHLSTSYAEDDHGYSTIQTPGSTLDHEGGQKSGQKTDSQPNDSTLDKSTTKKKKMKLFSKHKSLLSFPSFRRSKKIPRFNADITGDASFLNQSTVEQSVRTNGAAAKPVLGNLEEHIREQRAGSLDSGIDCINSASTTAATSPVSDRSSNPSSVTSPTGSDKIAEISLDGRQKPQASSVKQSAASVVKNALKHSVKAARPSRNRKSKGRAPIASPEDDSLLDLNDSTFGNPLDSDSESDLTSPAKSKVIGRRRSRNKTPTRESCAVYSDSSCSSSTCSCDSNSFSSSGSGSDLEQSIHSRISSDSYSSSDSEASQCSAYYVPNHLYSSANTSSSSQRIPVKTSNSFSWTKSSKHSKEKHSKHSHKSHHHISRSTSDISHKSKVDSKRHSASEYSSLQRTRHSHSTERPSKRSSSHHSLPEHSDRRSKRTSVMLDKPHKLVSPDPQYSHNMSLPLQRTSKYDQNTSLPVQRNSGYDNNISLPVQRQSRHDNNTSVIYDQWQSHYDHNASLKVQRKSHYDHNASLPVQRKSHYDHNESLQVQRKSNYDQNASLPLQRKSRNKRITSIPAEDSYRYSHDVSFRMQPSSNSDKLSVNDTSAFTTYDATMSYRNRVSYLDSDSSKTSLDSQECRSRTGSRSSMSSDTSSQQSTDSRTERHYSTDSRTSQGDSYEPVKKTKLSRLSGAGRQSGRTFSPPKRNSVSFNDSCDYIQAPENSLIGCESPVHVRRKPINRSASDSVHPSKLGQRSPTYQHVIQVHLSERTSSVSSAESSPKMGTVCLEDVNVDAGETTICDFSEFSDFDTSKSMVDVQRAMKKTAFWIENNGYDHTQGSPNSMPTKDGVNETDLCNQIIDIYFGDDNVDSDSSLSASCLESSQDSNSSLSFLCDENTNPDGEGPCPVETDLDNFVTTAVYVPPPYLAAEAKTRRIRTDEGPVKRRIKDTCLSSKPPPVPPRNRPSPIGQHSNQPRTERVLAERHQNSPQKKTESIRKKSKERHESSILLSPDHQPSSVLSEHEMDTLTKLHTICNSQRVVKCLNRSKSTMIIKHFPPPKHASRLSWCEKMEDSSYNHHTPKKTPSDKKGILVQRPQSFTHPYEDDTPSPIVITRVRRSKSLSKKKEWPW